MSCTSITADQLRPKLLAMARDEDSYPFISVAEDYLAAVPHDDQVRALLVGALVRKGLLSVAAELARGCPQASPNAVELHAAADQLIRSASEKVDWSTTDGRFTANLAGLRSRDGAGEILADQVEQTWQQLAPGLTLYKANDGNVQVRAVKSDGRGLWVPAALDYNGKVEALVDTDGWKGRILSPFLLEGVGIGALVPRLHAASRCTYLNHSPALYVVEPDLRALALALRLHDWTAALADERVCLFAGDSAWEQWRELLRNDSALPEPGQVNSLPAWFGRPPSPAVEMLEQVAQYRKSLQARHRRRAREAYNGRDLTFWARRYETAGADDPLRVLFITSRFTTFLQHSTRDMMAALERAGIATRLLIEEKDHSLLPKHSYLEAIADFRPDMVLVLDHHRHEYPDGFIDNLPFVCWIQDELPHLFSADAGDRLGPLDFTIGFGLTRCVLNHRYPADRFMPCKLAINPAKFARPPDAGEPEAALRCDAAYVSHHSEPPEELHARLRRMAGSEQMCRLMDAFFEETRPLMTSPRFNAAWDLDGLLRRIEEQTGICCSDETARERLMGLYVRPLADRTIRHTTLAWVADWADATGRTLHVYGRNWDRHPRFGRYARGVAEHGRHLGEIARAAAINLHCGTTSTLHQRVLEVVSAGGFVMVRHATLFDCYTAEHAALEKYMREHGVTRPTRVPIDRFPEDYRRTMRRRVALTGRPLTDFAEITEEDLLEHGARRERDQRYYYANLAFPDLDRINFDGPESFRRRADEFIADPQRRRAIARRMQQAVHELFTYDALVPRVISFVSEVLTAQVPAAGR